MCISVTTCFRIFCFYCEFLLVQAFEDFVFIVVWCVSNTLLSSLCIVVKACLFCLHNVLALSNAFFYFVFTVYWFDVM